MARWTRTLKLVPRSVIFAVNLEQMLGGWILKVVHKSVMEVVMLVVVKSEAV